MTIFASACSPIFLAVAWPHESIAESPSISTVIGWLVFRSFVLFIYQQNKHISITYFATPPFLYFWKQTDGSGKAPLVSQPISFLWAKPPLGRIIILWIQVMAGRLFQRSLSDHCVGRSLSFGKVMAYSPRGSLYHKRICLLYSVVKDHNGLYACQSPYEVI